ncbi:hypothetical protein WJX73_005263 [Symbiochloris irregularis]|uniref:Mitochondrial inner membrane protease subunit 1 n=1 Tax=Symbiochloris irregularis TaxID=706552 RepID=A0AAW1P7I0_9CHLO
MSFNLRYTLARLRLGIEEALSQLTTSTASVPEAISKGMETYNKQLTAMMSLTGAAMLPTLNASTSTESSNSPVVDSLLLRVLPRASSRQVFTGDVVAFNSPLSQQPEHSVLVRRVAASEGDEMVSDHADDQPFSLPEGHCWVLADNDELQPAEAIDSRSFGPLPFSNIIGRVMYRARSATDHGAIDNSAAAQAADLPVLESELDIDKLT